MTDDRALLRALTGAWVFDWNGTVVDDLDRAVTASNEVLAGLALPTLDVPRFRRTFSLPLSDFMRRAGVREQDRTAAVARWNEEVAGRRSPLRPDMEEVLRSVIERGDVVVVLSAASSDVVWGDARRLGVDRLLHEVVGAAEDKAVALDRLRDRYVLRAYIGDTTHDVCAGRAAGIPTIGLTGGYHDRPALAGADPDRLCDATSLLLHVRRA